VGLSPELSESVFEHLQLGIAVWRLEDLEDDASLTLQRGNRAACRMLGRELTSLYGKRMSAALPGTTSREWKAYADGVRSGEIVSHPLIREPFASVSGCRAAQGFFTRAYEKLRALQMLGAIRRVSSSESVGPRQLSRSCLHTARHGY
jgi:hypothetical protein